MADHTPGPWRVLFPGIYDVENPYPIAKVHKTERNGPEIDANARLIAAAPDMLEALEAAKRVMGPMATSFPNTLAIIDEAIAKATDG